MGKFRQILLSGALLLGVTAAEGASVPVFCGFERFRGQSESAYEACAEGAIYFDGEILFEGSASRPERADDRIVVWYRRASSSAAGELVVTAGFIDPNGLVTPRDYPVAAELEDGTYHRVTIRAVENILDETQVLPGFVVFLDGERLGCEASVAYAAEPERFPLGWAMRERFTDDSTRSVFPSLGVKKVGAAAESRIVRAGIQGSGGARDCVLTDEEPFEAIRVPVRNFRMGDGYYGDFDEVLAALAATATDAEHPAVLRLLADFAPEGGVMEIPAAMCVTLDLMGHRLEGAIDVLGNLTVIDTVGGGTVTGDGDLGYALYVYEGGATVRAGRWMSYLMSDSDLAIVAGEFYDDGLDEALSNGGFYLDGYDYLAKGSYLAKLDYENLLATVAAADSSKVTVTFVYGATVWATAQYTANGSDWPGVVAEPAATGYTFAGWLRADGTAWHQDYSVRSDQYVTAFFTNNVYTITFLNEDGGVYATRGYTYGVDELELPEPPVKDGYDFTSWYKTNPGDWRFDCMVAGDQRLNPGFTWHYETIEYPVARAGLVADGTLKTGVVEGVGYTLTGNAGTAAGAYVATAKLGSHYKWSSGVRRDAAIAWKIYTPEEFAEYAAAAVAAAVSGELEISADAAASVTAEGTNVTIVAGGIETKASVRPYYSVTAADGTLRVAMNGLARPKFAAAGGDGGEPAVTVGETEFSVTISNLHPGFSYRIGTKSDLAGEWTYQAWRTVGDEQTLTFGVARGAEDAAGFYVIEYTDGEVNQ